MKVSELVQMSNRHGKNPELVLAGGGNTSAKDPQTLFVKGSGTALATITEEGFVAMDRAKLNHIMNKQYPADDQAREAAFLADVMQAKCNPSEAKRPSVEALLHNLFPQTYVLHLHPALVNGLTCSVGGRSAAEVLFGTDIIWVDECRPGYTLAKLCFDQMQAYRTQKGKEVQAMLLQNHGVFFAADTVAEIDRLVDNVIGKLEDQINKKSDFSQTAIHEGAASNVQKKLESLYGGVSVHRSHAEALRFSESAETVKPLLYPFTPDHIVYCKAFPLFVAEPESIAQEFEAFRTSNGYAPKIVIVQGLGYFALGSDEKEAGTASMLFDDAMKIAVYAESFGGPRHMAEDMVCFIVNWEAESYRQKQSK